MITPMAQPPTTVREMNHDDLAMVSDIERRSYEFPCILSVAAGEAHILNLCVDPEFRSLGYGEQMLDELLYRARSASVREIFLEVRPSNETAIALYRKKGFHQVAARPEYYQANAGREDAAVLAKKLVVEP